MPILFPVTGNISVLGHSIDWMVLFAPFNSISVMSPRQLTLFMSFLRFTSARLGSEVRPFEIERVTIDISPEAYYEGGWMTVKWRPDRKLATLSWHQNWASTGCRCTYSFFRMHTISENISSKLPFYFAFDKTCKKWHGKIDLGFSSLQILNVRNFQLYQSRSPCFSSWNHCNASQICLCHFFVIKVKGASKYKCRWASL